MTNYEYKLRQLLLNVAIDSMRNHTALVQYLSVTPPPPLGAQEVGPSAPYHDQPRALCAGAGQHNEPLL